MSGGYDEDRRRFLKISGAAFAAGMAGSWSFEARADLGSVEAGFAHFTDTLFASGDKEGRSNALHRGYMIGETYALAQDLAEQAAAIAGREDFLLVHSGNLLRSGKKDQLAKVRSSLENLSPRTRLCFGEKDFSATLDKKAFMESLSGFGFESGKSYYSYIDQGVRFFHLDTSDAAPFTGVGRFAEREKQLNWLRRELEKEENVPAVLVFHSPPLEAEGRKEAELAEPDRIELLKVLKVHPRVVLVLCGGAMKNRAEFVPETNALCLVTCSPATYPCGCRFLELKARGSEIELRSRFLQSRLLHLVEKSFYYARPQEVSETLGVRSDRSFAAPAGERQVREKKWDMYPALAPFWKGADSLNLAVLADTHLCLNKYAGNKESGNYHLIGHFVEEGSKALYRDVLGQASEGRHRLEFYDEVFARDPDDRANYGRAGIDAVLICGDLTERGRREEQQLVLDGLNGLPASIRDNSMVAIGNHDMYTDFAPRGPKSTDEDIAEFYQNFGPRQKETDYVAHLTEWLSLIVLNTTIFGLNSLGLSQDRIDWLEDQLNGLKGRAVIVASHHPIYPISIVPPLMNAYLMTRTHFRNARSAARYQLHDLFARHPQVKLVLSGHYHGVCTDQFEKKNRAGSLPDDAYTTHIQVPCLIEYPCGYRVLKINRRGKKCTIEYTSAYTRLHRLREESRNAPIFKYLGTETRVSPRYKADMERVARQENFSAHVAMLDPYDLADLNVRGFKDGTANLGKGNTGKPNINGKLEFTV